MTYAETTAHHHYVTARDAGRTALLLGPFRTREEAERWVDKVRMTASEVDVRAWFYTYGTSRVRYLSDARPGLLNTRLRFHGCDHDGEPYHLATYGSDFCAEHGQSKYAEVPA